MCTMKCQCHFVTLLFYPKIHLPPDASQWIPQLSKILEENRKPVECLLVGVWFANLGSRWTVAIKRKHLTFIFMALNNPEVLIKMKANIGMKDPPTLAVFNVQDIPLKGKHFLRSGAFILIAYRKTGEGRKQNDLRRHNLPATVFCETTWQTESCTHVHEYSRQNAFCFCGTEI